MRNFAYLILLAFLLLMTQVIMEGLTWFMITQVERILTNEVSFKDFLNVMGIYFAFKVFVTTLVPYLLAFVLTASWILKSKTVNAGYIKIGILHFLLMVIPALIFLYYVAEGQYGFAPTATLLFYSVLLPIAITRMKPLESKIFNNTQVIKIKSIFLNTFGYFGLMLLVLGVTFHLLDPKTELLGGWGELMIITSILFFLFWLLILTTTYIYNLITKQR